MNQAGLRDINVRIAEKELKQGEKTGGVTLTGVTLQDMFHKNRLGQERLKNINNSLSRQRKEFSKKINQVERKFITIQVCRKDINPYITPPKAKVRPKLKRNPLIFRINDEDYKPFLPKIIKEENIQFSVTQRRRSYSADELDSDTLPCIVDKPKPGIMKDALQRRSKTTDSVMNFQNKFKTVIEEERRNNHSLLNSASTALPPLVSSAELVSASQYFAPAEQLEREISRLEFKQLKSKFNCLKSMMQERHGVKRENQQSPYLLPVTKSLTKHKGPFLCPLPKSPSKKNNNEKFQVADTIENDIREHSPKMSECSDMSLSCSCPDFETYNNYLDKLSMELLPAATQKLIKFKHEIIDTETKEAVKSRLLETNKKLNEKCAIKDQRWIDFEETMKKPPIILEKYRKKSVPKPKPEKYSNKLRFFAATNWMG